MLKIYWANSIQGQGNAMGYNTHYTNIKRATEQAGCETTFDTDLALHISTANRYSPIPGKRNVLYTMYELTTLPQSWIDVLRKDTPDLIIVPCHQNIKIFKQYNFGCPIEVVGEGTETNIFTYKERKFTEPFIFLATLAPNPRKGTQHIAAAWEVFIARHYDLVSTGRIKLYMKTTGISRGESVTEKFGITIDSRYLSREELVKLYHDAHCYVAPHMGEGWHLGCCEAAATGLPVIYTRYSGPMEFLDTDTGYPLNWEFVPAKTAAKNGEVEHQGIAVSANIEDIVLNMERVYYRYSEAAARGKRASERIHANFDWSHSAQRLIKCLNKYVDLWNCDCRKAESCVA